MRRSPLKRLWKAIQPPPAAGARPQRNNAPVATGAQLEDKRRQRKLLVGTASVLLVGAAAWGVYEYIASAPMRADEEYEQGMRLAGTGDYKGAEARFTKAVDIYPSLAAGYYHRGLARRSMNQTDAAMADFQEAISRDGSLGAAHTALGIIYRERGDTAHAIAEFSAGIQTSPSADSYYQLGQLYETQGDHQKAITDYDESIHEAPDAPYVYRARAMSRDGMGDHDQASQDRATAARIETH